MLCYSATRDSSSRRAKVKRGRRRAQRYVYVLNLLREAKLCEYFFFFAIESLPKQKLQCDVYIEVYKRDFQIYVHVICVNYQNSRYSDDLSSFFCLLTLGHNRSLVTYQNIPRINHYNFNRFVQLCF